MGEKVRRLIGYKDILMQENEVAKTTLQELHGAAVNVPKLIETLFHLSQQYNSERSDEENTEKYFHQYCWYTYYHLPYTLRACYLLWMRGYYLEASQLLRSILEVLVKMRYLRKYPKKVEAVWLNKKFKGNRISIKAIFDNVIPGYYEMYYGKLLSGFVHGGSAALIFKVELTNPETPAKVDWGLVYKENYASYVLNQLIAYIHSYLKFFPVALPNSFASLDTSVKKELDQSRSWCLECIESHKKEHPSSVKWYHQLEPLL